MNLSQFAKKVELHSKQEIERVKFVFFYLRKTTNKEDVSVSEVTEMLHNIGFSRPNASRLNNNLSKSKDFIKGASNQSFRLKISTFLQLENQLTNLFNSSEEIATSSSILPESLYLGTRGYIEVLSKQINASYENNIFDGCAVLMRRLVEILLIACYHHQKKEDEIQEVDGGYKNLNHLITNTRSKKYFMLSKGTLDCLDVFRKLGNYSAHTIQYYCRKQEIDIIKMEFRVAIEELLYASHIKK